MGRVEDKLKSKLYIFECAEESIRNISGDDDLEEIPVPIPNTEVKLQSADDTSGLPCVENRLSPDFFYIFRYIL